MKAVINRILKEEDKRNKDRSLAKVVLISTIFLFIFFGETKKTTAQSILEIDVKSLDIVFFLEGKNP